MINMYNFFLLFQLESELQGVEGLLVYKKENIPEKYHLKHNKLTPPILLVARKGYYISKVSFVIILNFFILLYIFFYVFLMIFFRQ